jgi:hypothetical protein
MMAKGNGHQDPRVTSLDDARKRAAEKVKEQQRAAKFGGMPGAQPRGPRTTRDWIIGGVIIAMALGFVVSLVMRGAQMFGGGN